MRVLARIVLACAIAGPLVGPKALAQTTSAALVGTVRATAGDTAAGARVDARNVETGAARSAVTGADGQYRLEGLEPGNWAVHASLPGQEDSESIQVRLRLQQVLRVDLALGASIHESVTVSGSAPALDRTRTGAELRLGAEQIADIPTVGRSLTDLALLDSAVLPALTADLYGEKGSVFVINGQSGRANSFLVDGLDNNDRTSGTSLNSYFSPLAVREVVVNTHQFAPEFGRASGGVFNIITERGGNDRTAGGLLQGTSAGWNEPGPLVDSLPASGDQNATPERLQAGLKLGGAFVPDKAFYYFSYEHQKLDEIVPFTGTDRDGVAGGWTVAPNRADNLFFRTDFAPVPAHQWMFRLSADDRTTNDLAVGGTRTPESGFEVSERDLQLAAAWTVLRADAIHEARLLLGRSTFDQTANSDRPGVERPSGTFGGNNLNRQMRTENKAQLVDNFTWRRSRHTWKFGADLTWTRTGITTDFNPQGNFTYDTDRPWEPGDGYVIGDPSTKCIYATDPDQMPCPGQAGVDDDGDLLIDEDADKTTYPSTYQLIFGHPAADLDDLLVGLFAQDSWEVNDRLLLDYGLRYDLSTFRLPSSAVVDSVVPNGNAGIDTNNLAPRAGFTWTPSAGGKLLLRGGAGMFYDKVVVGFPAVAAITSGTAIGLTFPQGLAFEINEDVVEQLGVDAILADIVFPEELILRFSTGTELDTPYTTLYHLGGEWRATGNGAFEVNAVRSLGYHVPLFLDLNPVVGTNFLGLPVHAYDSTVGSIAAIVTEGRSWYSGLDVAWKWQTADGWYRVSYTLGKSIDEGPDPLKGGVYLPPTNRLGDEKGRADSDRRHRLVLSGGLPLGFAGLRLSGMVQFASGAPFNVTTGTDDNLDGITSDRPAGVGRNTGERTSLAAINDVRIAAGLVPVTSLKEPTLAQIDLRVAKTFASSESRSTCDFYLQVFNLMNRFNGGPVEGRVTSASFGEPVGYAAPPRTIEVGVRLDF